jgi:hypothetical protein
MTDRIATFRIPQQLLVDFLGNKGMLHCPGLPGGARVVDVHHDYVTRSFVVLLEHPEFYPIKEGHPAPSIGIAEIVFFPPEVKQLIETHIHLVRQSDN